MKLFYLIIAFSFASTTLAERILVLLPLATKSHKNVFEPLIKALADKGHSVVVASPTMFPQPHQNIREIVPVPYDQVFKQMTDPFEQRRQGMAATLNFNSWTFIWDTCEAAYLNPEFKSLASESFDLILYNGFMNHCFHGIIYKIGAPFIMVTTLAVPSFLADSVGNYLPPSFVPLVNVDASDDMNFKERLVNIVWTVLYKSLIHLYFDSVYHECYTRHLEDPTIPLPFTIDRNMSLILSNSYFPLTYPRPLLPDIVEVGGMHCRPPKPLPQDLDDFLSGAKDGFILFSMGSVVNTDKMTEDMRLKFLNVFAKLKQRVIWKWNSGKMEGLPPNVRVSSWLPQQDILGHPNIRMFITHGGLLSTQEAAYHGVPLLGIPVFADQDLNMKQAERGGYALTLEVLDFTEEIFQDLITKLLNDPKYSSKAKHLSSVIKDQMQTPLERAVFWAEYVMRHKGAVHMRSAARNLNFFQYHSLDVAAFLISILAAILAVVFVILRACLKLCFRRKATSKNADLKKKLK